MRWYKNHRSCQLLTRSRPFGASGQIAGQSAAYMVWPWCVCRFSLMLKSSWNIPHRRDQGARMRSGSLGGITEGERQLWSHPPGPQLEPCLCWAVVQQGPATLTASRQHPVGHGQPGQLRHRAEHPGTGVWKANGQESQFPPTVAPLTKGAPLDWGLSGTCTGQGALGSAKRGSTQVREHLRVQGHPGAWGTVAHGGTACL